MKSKIMLANIFLILSTSFFSCTIEGEQICGIWNSESEFGQMKMEITPWDGNFLGYLLESKFENETFEGGKTEENIILTDLVFEGNTYENGKIYIDPNSEENCAVSIEFLNENNLKVAYNCAGQIWEEVWTRQGFENERIALKKEEKYETETVESENVKVEIKTLENPNADDKKAEETQIQNDIQNDTRKASTFHVIGISETIAYDDMKAIEKAVEALWTKSYSNDFSGKINNISDMENMYAIYSNYDNPKGKMTITIGYKVKDLSNVPSGLKGVTVPMNDYYVYPVSGETSDYEGEGWNQMAELMAYRKAESCDFEVYKFDANYEVTEAHIWIAAK